MKRGKTCYCTDRLGQFFLCIYISHLHLSDAFIQSDLQCIQDINLYYQYVCSLGIEPTTFALLTQCSNHWATETLCNYISHVYLLDPYTHLILSTIIKDYIKTMHGKNPVCDEPLLQMLFMNKRFADLWRSYKLSVNQDETILWLKCIKV